jgi:hypothetical protein
MVEQILKRQFAAAVGNTIIDNLSRRTEPLWCQSVQVDNKPQMANQIELFASVKPVRTMVVS